MKFRIPVLPMAVLFLTFSCKSKDVAYNSTIEVIQQFSELQAIMDAQRDKLLVLNFWATTCAPCIKEMPHFNRLEKEYRDKNVKILLISLDRVKDLDSRVYAFVQKHEITPEVAILKDQDYSAWTNKIDTSWYGALPATLIIKGDQRKFRFGIYESYEDLQTDLNEFLNK